MDKRKKRHQFLWAYEDDASEETTWHSKIYVGDIHQASAKMLKFLEKHGGMVIDYEARAEHIRLTPTNHKQKFVDLTDIEQIRDWIA